MTKREINTEKKRENRAGRRADALSHNITVLRTAADYGTLFFKHKIRRIGLVTKDIERRCVWLEESGVPLSASYGCAAHAEFPDKRITELARTADDRMYAAKAAYYRTGGRERRRFRAEAPV